MKKNINLEIEKAKTFFVLAQIIIILSGFMFATSGIHYNNARESEIRGHEILLGVADSILSFNNIGPSPSLLNSAEEFYKATIERGFKYIDEGEEENTTSKRYFYTGIILAIIAIILILIGRLELSRIKIA